MNATAAGTETGVRLTPHPLQRVGAFALASLAKVDGVQRSPQTLTVAEIDVARKVMTDDVVATARLADTKAPGSFWLSASYLFWPNSKMNPTNRKSLSVPQRREQIQRWREIPREVPEALSGVPCVLCGQAACGFYGKVDIPLAASVEHRNTTVPGHDGMALCSGCLTCFYAMPYGCSIRGGKAAALHSWDDHVLAAMTRRQVRRTRWQVGRSSTEAAPSPYSREVEALRALRTYEDEMRDGVELFVFSNSNKQQTLDVHGIEQPLAEWLRSTLHSLDLVTGFRYLIRAHYSPKSAGSVRLAYNAFRYPYRIPMTIASYLARLTSELEAPPPETDALAQVYRSFIKEVFGVAQRDVDQIVRLGDAIGALLREKPQRGTLKEFEHVHSDPLKLQGWLKRQATAWTLQQKIGEPLVTTEQWRLLFEPGDRIRLNRDLLFVAVLEHLARHDWLAGTPEARDDHDDTILTEDEQ
ncbi:hypothetical protein [Nocardia arizonensis]|uniref:hypothetical protein n=1 Tax=Nocardia arizonensis TaxID=1141647 RepID=UPI000AA8EB58|nr:hypothetical protein [Nocardia arizonensis]